MALAASITQTLQRIGNALGVAVAVTILGSRSTRRSADYRRMFAAMTVAALITSSRTACCPPRTDLPDPPFCWRYTVSTP
jgi:hypothetical protein